MASAGSIKIGTLSDLKLANSTLPISEGFPAYVPDARAYIVLVDPSRQEFIPGTDTTGDGTALNVRPLYQRCPHLGCRPNPCLKTSGSVPLPRVALRPPGHQGGRRPVGPAPRSMDRFSANVKDDGTLWLDTGKITLGPLPVALGQPGIIPPKTPTGCI